MDMRSWVGPCSSLAPVVALLAALGCGPDTSLAGRTFLSTRVTEGGAPRELVKDTRLEIDFFDEDTVNASAGCNPFGGGYSLDGGKLVITNGSAGLIACDDARHEQEQWYFDFLLSRPSIAVSGDSLVLEAGSIRVEYLDQEVAMPDVELTGVTWTVETVIAGGLAQVAEWPSPATLELGSDGTVEVYTGCNGGTGTYAVSGMALTFADVAVSERGCDEPTAALERAVLGVVQGPQPVTWEVTAERLSLRGDEFGLDLVASDR